MHEFFFFLMYGFLSYWTQFCMQIIIWFLNHNVSGNKKKKNLNIRFYIQIIKKNCKSTNKKQQQKKNTKQTNQKNLALQKKRNKESNRINKLIKILIWKNKKKKDIVRKSETNRNLCIIYRNFIDFFFLVSDLWLCSLKGHPLNFNIWIF